jgi:hypothetical protein
MPPNVTFTDADLERLMADLESDHVERKEQLAGEAPTKVREAICAFANDLSDSKQPGVVFIGVKDSGVPVGSCPALFHIDRDTTWARTPTPFRAPSRTSKHSRRS